MRTLVVYVQSPDGEGFEARQISIRDQDNLSAAIEKGLQPGEVYVSEGGFHLKAESQKEDFGDGHDH